ncbi:solute carrier family 2 member 9, like 1 isoform X2 [Salmo salar]|uniref:Solute carrier family 2 member 9, like 1 isoform X2 n=1 Tax=Salmo salar TaxID=8030 RepID=A0A1S3LEH9_SALSA|nr:solute carrier family 2 member 9, like 1 isoform X2 [Salmo salar]|eukprot:XP_013988909.1 PREDICTED: solute carrier family 2, facilitated glucose transporter member 9-like isoform X2 [Salmo salar]
METLLRRLTRGNALVFIIILGIGGSFQNGFHVTVISSPSPYIWSFINSSWIGRYEETPPAQTVKLLWSAIVSMYAVGGLLGSMSVRCIAGRFGRKRAMIWNNVVSIVAAVIMFTSRGANSFEMILIARFLFGFTAGLGANIHAIYLGESSPKKIRGMVTLTFATFISIGKLSGQFFGLREILGREDSWNILLCVSTCFSVVQLLTLPFFPEAPRYLLIEKGNTEACKKALQSLWGRGEYKLEMTEMVLEQAAIKGETSKSLLELLRDRSVRWQLITMVVMYGCIQFSGITAGLLIESVGRRALLWGGFGAMSAIMILITITLNLKDYSFWIPYSTVGLIFLFVIFYGGGPAGVLPSLTHEIFIQSCRPAAFVFTGILRWLGFAVLGLVFPFLIELLKSFSFVLFACMCLLASFYIFFYLPETKGKTLLEISEEFKNITLCENPPSDDKTLETRL